MTDHSHPEDDHLHFTGERLILEPGTAWFWEGRAAEHITRYLFAADRVGGCRVLDAACGTGYGSALLARTASSVIGVDIDPATVEFASRRWGSAAMSFQVADVTRLPFADGTFDAVVSFETIEHVADPGEVLDEFRRVLVPGGLLIVSTPWRDVYNWVSFPDGDGNPFHPSELNPDEFSARLGQGYAIDGMYGQVHVPGYGARSDRPRVGGTPSPARQLVKQLIKRTTSSLLSNPRVAATAVRMLRPGFVPQPMDERPWKYVVAVARTLR